MLTIVYLPFFLRICPRVRAGPFWTLTKYCARAVFCNMDTVHAGPSALRRARQYTSRVVGLPVATIDSVAGVSFQTTGFRSTARRISARDLHLTTRLCKRRLHREDLIKIRVSMPKRPASFKAIHSLNKKKYHVIACLQ